MVLPTPQKARTPPSEASGPSRVTGFGRWPDPGHKAPDDKKGTT
jgi:hypothetical protein